MVVFCFPLMAPRFSSGGSRISNNFCLGTGDKHILGEAVIRRVGARFDTVM